MKTASEKEKKNKGEKKIPLPEIREYVTSAYLFMMLGVFPLYFRKGFILISSYKAVYYRNVSLFFMALALVLFIPMVISKEFFNKIRSKGYSLVDYAVLAYGLWNVVSFLLSPYKEGSIRGYAGWEMGLVTQGLMVFGYFISRCWYDKGKGTLMAAGIAAIIQGVLVVLNRTGNDPLGFYKEMDWFSWDRRNLIGTIGNINWLGGYMIVVLPVLIFLYIQADKFWKRLLWGIGLYLAMAAIMLSGTRSTLFAMVMLLLLLMIPAAFSLWTLTRYLEILFMIGIFWSQMTLFTVDLIEPMRMDTPHTVYSPLWYIPTVILLAGIIGMNVLLKHRLPGKQQAGKGGKNREDADYEYMPKEMWNLDRSSKYLTPPKAVTTAMLILPGVVMAAGLLVFVLCQFSDSLWHKLGSKELLRFSDSWGSYRILLWKETLRFFKREGLFRWLVGVGPDAYGTWYMDRKIEVITDGEFVTAMYTNAHNEWITALVNTGIIGVFSYLAIFVLAIRLFGKRIKEEPMAMLGMLTVVVYLLNQLVSFQQICATPLFFILLGMCERLCDKDG